MLPADGGVAVGALGVDGSQPVATRHATAMMARHGPLRNCRSATSIALLHWIIRSLQPRFPPTLVPVASLDAYQADSIARRRERASHYVVAEPIG